MWSQWVIIIRPHTGNTIWQTSGEMPPPEHTNVTAASLERTPDQSPDSLNRKPEIGTMNDTPTPETDAAKFRLGDSNHFVVHETIARKIERERDEAWERERVAIASWDEERQRTLRECGRVLKARRERDEARAQRDRLAEAL